MEQNVYYHQQQDNRAQMEVDASLNSAFNKSLASTIMAYFPICGLIAIFVGLAGLKGLKKTEELAMYYGVQVGKKRVATRILGMVGTISGVVSTLSYLVAAIVFIAEIYAIYVLSGYFA